MSKGTLREFVLAGAVGVEIGVGVEVDVIGAGGIIMAETIDSRNDCASRRRSALEAREETVNRTARLQASEYQMQGLKRLQNGDSHGLGHFLASADCIRAISSSIGAYRRRASAGTWGGVRPRFCACAMCPILRIHCRTFTRCRVHNSARVHRGNARRNGLIS